MITTVRKEPERCCPRCGYVGQFKPYEPPSVSMCVGPKGRQWLVTFHGDSEPTAFDHKPTAAEIEGIEAGKRSSSNDDVEVVKKPRRQRQEPKASE
jgi:hypothetical protein